MKWKLDKKALSMAVGIMLMSWAALPIVYWLLVKKHKKEMEKNGPEGNTGRDKERDT